MSNDQIIQILNLLVAVIFPVLVGLVTTKTTNSGLKAALLATISLGSGLASQLIANGIDGFDWFTALVTGLGAWVVAIATHYGFWKPTGASDAVQAVGAKHSA